MSHNAFVFADPANRQRDLESVGIWWMAPDLKIAFWRPLAAATQLIDFGLWSDSALLMHVHTLVWFALLLLAIAALYDPRAKAVVDGLTARGVAADRLTSKGLRPQPATG